MESTTEMRDQVTRFAALPLVAAATLLLGPTSAQATLGESAATVDRDARALSAERLPSAARGSMGVHELRKETLTVREFADASGTVFAVAWTGIARPDLGALLGAHHAAYRSAARQSAPVRGPRTVNAGTVVVQTWGHGRNLGGRAWLPSLLPAGVTVDEIR